MERRAIAKMATQLGEMEMSDGDEDEDEDEDGKQRWEHAVETVALEERTKRQRWPTTQ